MKRNSYIYIFIFSIERAFVNIDGILLRQLYQMKKLAPESYFRLIEKHFGLLPTRQMSDILKFDYELESLFQ